MASNISTTRSDMKRVKKVRVPKSTEALTQESHSLESVNLPQPDPLPKYDEKFNPIHEYVVECDPDIEWTLLKKWIKRKPLSLKDAMEMLAVQPDMAMRAKRLSLLAKKELERFTLDYKERTGVLRDLAIEHWEERKRQGMRKQITNEMIEDWVVENYGDTWTEMKMRVRDMKNAARLLDQLSEQVITRAPDLRKMIDKFAEKTADPTWFTNQKKRRRTKRGRATDNGTT